MFKKSIDDTFFKTAEAFFEQSHLPALTYDDISLVTQYSNVLPAQTRLETRLSDKLILPIPIISSDMDTVTRWKMAVAMALQGGLGILHYNMSLNEQLEELKRVKHFVNGLIQEPVTLTPEDLIGNVISRMELEGYSFSSFPVVDHKKHLLGFLPAGTLKRRYSHLSVNQAMIPRESLSTIQENELGKDPIATADVFFSKHVGVNKLLVVDQNNRLRGLFTLSDVESIIEESVTLQRPCRDDQFRLACAVAISLPRTIDGSLDKAALISHVEALVAVGADAIALSTAHGYTEVVGNAVRLLRDAFPSLTLIAGNVTSSDGVEFLAKQGANAIKVGQGPGSICTTRLVAGVGIPQMTALYVCSKAAKKCGVSILADGGISKSGDIVKALTLADAVICGGILAACPEAPGSMIEIDGKRYKQYRGMGSMAAMKAGSAARYGYSSSSDRFRKVAAEGVEALKELDAPVSAVLARLLGGVQSGLGYLGAQDLKELREKARFVQVSAAGQRESAPHDIVEIKTSRS
jgi:IMP dehydrogenase